MQTLQDPSIKPLKKFFQTVCLLICAAMLCVSKVCIACHVVRLLQTLCVPYARVAMFSNEKRQVVVKNMLQH